MALQRLPWTFQALWHIVGRCSGNYNGIPIIWPPFIRWPKFYDELFLSRQERHRIDALKTSIMRCSFMPNQLLRRLSCAIPGKKYCIYWSPTCTQLLRVQDQNGPDCTILPDLGNEVTAMPYIENNKKERVTSTTYLHRIYSLGSSVPSVT